jgi:hypothetical protein
VHGALGRNVLYDAASDHRWGELKQRPFLETVFAHLRDELGAAFDDYTFHVVSSHNPDVRPQSLDADGARKVLLWISNESAATPTALAPHYHAVFKTHLPAEMPGTNIFAFNIGYAGHPPRREPTPMAERPINVFFSGQLTLDRRPLYCALHPVYGRLPSRVFDHVLSLRRRGFRRLYRDDLSSAVPGSILRFTDFFMEGLSPAEYLRLLGECRIALCPPGARDPETFRHLEATRAGAVVVSLPMPSTHFYRGAPFVIVDDWRAGIARCRELLEDGERLADLQAATLRWWDEVCCERATARYVAECLRASST